MKTQFSSYDAIIATSLLLVFFIALYFSIPKINFEKERYIKILSYDILFSLDITRRIQYNYDILRSDLQNLLISLGLIPSFFISDYGLWRREINISCICDNETILLLNNIYRNVEINGRTININFFYTNFPLTQTDFENHGLIVFGCNSDISIYESLIRRYLKVNGLLLICDIDTAFFNNNINILNNVFNLTIGNNNRNPVANLSKPKNGASATYKAYKIIKYQFNIDEKQNLLIDNVVVAPRDESMYLFRQENSNVAAVTMTYYENNIVAWTINFYRDKFLDENERRILLALILSVAAHKEVKIPEEFRKNLIGYVNFHYSRFIEPFILYFSVIA